MPTDGEALKAKLLAQAEVAIEVMLNKPEVHPEMTLSEMEQVVGVLGAELEQQVLQELVKNSQSQEVGRCPDCGGKLRHKGKRPKRVVTVRGEIEVERTYYTCETCETGHFPPR